MTATSHIYDISINSIEVRDHFDGGLGFASIYAKGKDHPHLETGKTIEGWQWDKRRWPKQKIVENMQWIQPLWDPPSTTIPKEDLQAGVENAEKDKNLSLVEVEEIDEGSGIPIWRPKFRAGTYYFSEYPQNFCSDEAATEIIRYPSRFSSSTKSLSLPISEQFRWMSLKSYYKDSSGTIKIFKNFNKVVTFSNPLINPEFIYENGEVEWKIPSDAYDEEGLELDRFQMQSFDNQNVAVLSKIPVQSIKSLTVGGTPWVYDGATRNYQNGSQICYVDYLNGELAFYNNGESFSPGNININYRPGLELKYETESSSGTVSALDLNLNPITKGLDSGFVYLKQGGLDPQNISLKIVTIAGEKEEETAYLGGNTYRLEASITDSDGTSLAGIPVTFKVGGGGIGKLSNGSLKSESITQRSGKASSYYVTPRTIEEIGELANPIPNSNIFSNPFSFDISNIDPSEFFIYAVYNDDLFLGATPTQVNNNYQEDRDKRFRTAHDLPIPKEYDPASKASKKRIITINNPSAINPHTGHLGAYSPLYPVGIDGSGNISYSSSVDFSTITSLGGNSPKQFFIVARGLATVIASVYNERQRKYIESSPVTFDLRVPNYMKGITTINELNGLGLNLEDILFPTPGTIPTGQSTDSSIPLGWRLKDSTTSIAGMLGGVAFLDMNPQSYP